METLNNLSSAQVAAFIIFLLGLALRYAIGRRRFERTNYNGVQLYSSYAGKVALTILEKLVSLIGMLMLLFAVFLFIIGSAEKSAKDNHDVGKAAASTHQK